MNTHETTSLSFEGTPSVRGLFHALHEVIVAWITARRRDALDFRHAQEDEVTPEMRKHIETVRNASNEDFVNI